MMINNKTTTATSASAVVFRPLGGAAVGAEATGVLCTGVAAGATAAGAGATGTGAGATGTGAGAGAAGCGGRASLAAGGADMLGHCVGGMMTVAPKLGCDDVGRSAVSGAVGAPQS